MIAEYRQSNSMSCGAAALMTALRELGKCSALNSEEEMKIWGKIWMSPNEPYSLPGKMALYTLEEGLIPEIYNDSNEIDRLLNLGIADDDDFAEVIGEHSSSLKEAERQGIKIIKSSTNLIDTLTNRDSKLLLVVLVPFKIDPHYLLLRKEDNSFTLLDPADGNNRILDIKTVRDFLKGHPSQFEGKTFIGVAISIKKD